MRELDVGEPKAVPKGLDPFVRLHVKQPLLTFSVPWFKFMRIDLMCRITSSRPETAVLGALSEEKNYYYFYEK